MATRTSRFLEIGRLESIESIILTAQSIPRSMFSAPRPHEELVRPPPHAAILETLPASVTIRQHCDMRFLQVPRI